MKHKRFSHFYWNFNAPDFHNVRSHPLLHVNIYIHKNNFLGVIFSFKQQFAIYTAVIKYQMQYYNSFDTQMHALDLICERKKNERNITFYFKTVILLMQG